jgi:two-component system cell cycle response regulator
MSIEKEKDPNDLERTVHLDPTGLVDLSAVSQERDASFVVMGGVDVGRSLPLSTKEPVVIGRDPECSYRIHDDGISRRHAEITYEAPGKYTIRDLNSTNGMFFEGKRVKSHLLDEGDKILLGRRTVIKFVLQDAFDLQYHKQIYESTVRDPLTGVFNRKHFDQYVAAELSFARRHRLPLTVMMIDLDHFKGINDLHGHQTGDQVLIFTAETLSDSLRDEDLLIRYGGEEFVIITRGIPPEGASALGERVRQTIEQMALETPEGESISITASIGAVTVSDPTGIDGRRLLRESDENLYRAKEAGRNRVVTSEIRSLESPILTSKRKGRISTVDRTETDEGDGRKSQEV